MYLNYRDLDANVIIIGAGLTGLSAAFHLLERDPHLDFLILDVEEKWNILSSQQDSSLINTKRSNSNSNQNLTKKRKFVTFEDELANSLRSQFVCTMQKDTIKLLKDFKIPIRKTIDKSGKILVDYYGIHKVTSRNEILNFLSTQDENALKSCCNMIDQLSKNLSFNYDIKDEALLLYDDMKMNDFLDKLEDKQIVKDIITQTFLVNTGLQSTDVSALFFLAYCNSTQGIFNQFHKCTDGLYQFQIDGGAEHLRSKLIEQIGEESIVKVPAVTKISWDETSVGIKTTKEYFFAERAIYTLNADDTENIEFTPHLSKSKKTIYGNSVRGVLKQFGVIYENPFWINKDLCGDVYVMDTQGENGPIKICLNISQMENGKYVLIGLADKDCQRFEILEQLSIYFGEEAAEPKYYAENQNSFLDLNFPLGFVTLKHFEDLRTPLGRIIWSGPETAVRWYGCLSGSIDAGFKGALDLLSDIRPHSFAFEDSQLMQPNFVEIPPRRLGVFGFHWHSIIPTVLLAIFVIVKLRKYGKRILLQYV